MNKSDAKWKVEITRIRDDVRDSVSHESATPLGAQLAMVLHTIDPNISYRSVAGMVNYLNEWYNLDPTIYTDGITEAERQLMEAAIRVEKEWLKYDEKLAYQTRRARGELEDDRA